MITGNKVVIREKKLSDAWDDYSWETDPELADLDAAPAVNITFCKYLSEYASEMDDPVPTSRRFAVDTSDGRHIGNCSYYHINTFRGEAELGIMIGDRGYWDKGYGTDAVKTLVDYIFRKTNLKRIYLKTLESNDRAQRCFLGCGFTPYTHLANDGYRFELMQLFRHDWEQPQKSEPRSK